MRKLLSIALLGASVALAAPTGAALAAVTAAQVENARGTLVFSNDGALIGELRNGYFESDNIRLILRPIQNSMFRRYREEVIVRVSNERISFDGERLILDASGQSIRSRADTPTRDATSTRVYLR